LSASGEDAMRYCAVNINPEEADKIYRDDTFTRNGGVPLHAAPLTALRYDGIAINPSEVLGEGSAPGMLAFEAAEAGESVTLLVKIEDEVVYTFRMPISISSVKDMYRWNNLRYVCGGSGGESSSVDEPWNFPDEETNGKDVFFLHGFNVSADSARNWANQMFKRLWLSGSRAKFHGIAWYGDYNLVSGKFNGLHYHQDVFNALQTAYSFKSYVESEQSDSALRILIAHSLGNMVANEAFRLGLAAGHYFMCNAAVASESFDGSLQAKEECDDGFSKYVPDDWRQYPSDSWAANWHRHFEANSDDSRREMGWPNRYVASLENVRDVCNYYSSGDEVFDEMPSAPSILTGVFHWPTLKLSWPFIDLSSMLTPEVNVWQKQEVLKGVDAIAGTLCAGWGFHCWTYYPLGSEDSVTVKYSAQEAQAMIADGSIITNDVFDRTYCAMLNPSATQMEQWETLAKYVPAVSSAAGKVVSGVEIMNNFNLNDSTYRDDWGRNHNKYNKSWLHSDMKDMSYRYVNLLFDDFVSRGEMK
jgi:hypothetical protein